MDGLKKWWKNLTMFEKVSAIIIPILISIIIISAIIITNKNYAIQELKRKNDEITQNLYSIQQINLKKTTFQDKILKIYKL